MAISLSELTGASTSGNVLNEVNSYADFLDSCPRFVNKADPSGATDAVQTVATKQPIALPLIDGEGYLFLSGIDGNYAELDSPVLPATSDFDVSIDLHKSSTGSRQIVFSQYNVSDAGRFFIYIESLDYLGIFWGGSFYLSSTRVTDGRHTIRVTKVGYVVTVYLDGVEAVNATRGDGISQQANFQIGVFEISGSFQSPFKGAIFSVTEANGLFDIDFTSPRIPHGATEFTCETGQVVTVNTSGNNPAKVIKKPVLRFDGVNGFLTGLFDQTITEGGYAFAAFSVLGDGGGEWARVLSFNPTGGDDYQNGGYTFIIKSGTTNDMSLPTGTDTGMFDDANGDILVEAGRGTNYRKSRVNDASVISQVAANTMSFDEFNLGASGYGTANASIDLEYLALFPATLTDAQADQVRNFINNRNKVFYRWDTDGYYFFDGAATDDGQVFSGSGSWNGRIVGSDNGDSDFYANENTTSENRPTTDGYKVTFADNSDKLDIPQVTLAAGDSYAWMVCGTSLGTFAYKVTVSGETELNLLGHLGNASYRKAGDLYGIILLPQNATNREIEEARKLLIDRGAADGAVGSFFAAWFTRTDIVEFKHVDTSAVTNVESAWSFNNFSSFPALDLSNSTTFANAWKDCSSLTSFPADSKLGTETNYVNFNNAWRSSGLTSFPALDLSNGNNFTNAWRDASSLTEISSGLQLGTNPAYTGVSFTRAWQGSGLTSFPALDLSNGNSFDNAWSGCTSLQSFPEDALLGTEASNVNFSAAWQSSGLKSFSTPLPTAINCTEAWKATPITSFNLTSLPEVEQLYSSFQNCNQLTSFSTAILKSKRMLYCWRNCSSLTDFSADVFANWNPSVINDRCFDQAWYGCTSLTAQSVENILVPIAASGKWATSTGLEGGSGLTDATIDIDYDVTTGSLTAATLSAIETLNGRGWSVNINNQIIVPNILQLQPAAAYSLRSFDADADPTVVNVRRSSDGSLSDFTASQVSDGTLTDWVNTDVVQYTSDFSSGVDNWTPNGATASNPSDPVNPANNVLQLTVGVSGSIRALQYSILTVGQSYNISAEVYIPSSNTEVNGVLFLDGFNVDGIFADGEALPTDQWVTVTGSGVSEETHLRIQLDNTDNDLNDSLSSNAIGDTVYVKNIQVTQTTADGYVTTWYDQSGSGNMVQSVGSEQPLIVANGVLVTKDGQPAIDFDGVDDYLGYAGDFFGTSTASMFVVSSFDNATASRRDVIAGGQDTSGTRYDFVIVRQSGGAIEPYIEGVPFSGGTSTLDTDQHLYTVVHNGSTSSGFVNKDGTNTSTFSSSASVTSVTDFRIGEDIGATSANLDGQIQEIVVFNTDQAPQANGIEKNINDHFNIYS